MGLFFNTKGIGIMDHTQEKEIFPDDDGIKRQVKYVKSLKQRLVLAEKALQDSLIEYRAKCDHRFLPVMKYDPSYCGRVDGQGMGQDIYVGKECQKCGLFEPRPAGFPWQVCHKCGGRMKHDHQENVDLVRVHINKCQNCGHEHDTT